MSQCLALILYDGLTGLRVKEPRQCRREALAENLYCTIHAKMRKRYLESAHGGFCIYCAAPAKRYFYNENSRITHHPVHVALCNPCAKALRDAINANLVGEGR